MNTRVEFGLHTDLGAGALVDGKPSPEMVRGMESRHLDIIALRAYEQDLSLDLDSATHILWPYIEVYAPIEIDGEMVDHWSIVSCKSDAVVPDGYRLETTCWAVNK